MNDAHRFSGFYHWANEFQRRGGNQFTPRESRNIYEGPITTVGATRQAVRGSGLVFSLQAGRWFQDAYNFAEPGPDDPTNHKVSTIDSSTQVVPVTHWRTARISNGGGTMPKGPRRCSSRPLQGEPRVQGRIRLPRVRVQRGQELAAGWQTTSFGSTTVRRSRFHVQLSRPAEEHRSLSGPLRAGQLACKQQSDAQPRDAILDRPLVSRRRSATRPPTSPQPPATTKSACGRGTRSSRGFMPHTTSPAMGKSVLKGRLGRFSQLRDIDPDLTQANRNGPQTTTWTWRDLNGNRDYDPGEVNLDPNNGGDFISIAGITNAVPNPDENQPKTDEFSLTFEPRAAGQLGRADDRRLQPEFRPPAHGRAAASAVGLLRSRSPTPIRAATAAPARPMIQGRRSPQEYSVELRGGGVRRHDVCQRRRRADLQDDRIRGDPPDGQWLACVSVMHGDAALGSVRGRSSRQSQHRDLHGERHLGDHG